MNICPALCAPSNKTFTQITIFSCALFILPTHLAHCLPISYLQYTLHQMSFPYYGTIALWILWSERRNQPDVCVDLSCRLCIMRALNHVTRRNNSFHSFSWSWSYSACMCDLMLNYFITPRQIRYVCAIERWCWTFMSWIKMYINARWVQTSTTCTLKNLLKRSSNNTFVFPPHSSIEVEKQK